MNKWLRVDNQNEIEVATLSEFWREDSPLVICLTCPNIYSRLTLAETKELIGLLQEAVEEEESK